MDGDKEQLKGLGLGFVGVLIFGLTLPASRTAVAEFSPVVVGLGRAVMAAAVAALLLWLNGEAWPARRYWNRLFWSALGVAAGFPLFSAMAMQHVPATHGGVVLGLLPLATAAAAVLFARERPSLAFWLWGLLGASLVTAFALREGAGGLHLADLYLAAAIVSAAGGYAISGDLSRQLGGWRTICWGLIFCLPVTLPATLVVLPDVDWQASLPAWAGFFYVALFSQLIGFFAWNRGLALGGVARVSQIQLLQTFVTLAAGALLLGEHVDLATVLFALAVAAVVALGQREQVTRKEES